MENNVVGQLKQECYYLLSLHAHIFVVQYNTEARTLSRQEVREYGPENNVDYPAVNFFTG